MTNMTASNAHRTHSLTCTTTTKTYVTAKHAKRCDRKTLGAKQRRRTSIMTFFRRSLKIAGTAHSQSLTPGGSGLVHCIRMIRKKHGVILGCRSMKKRHETLNRVESKKLNLTFTQLQFLNTYFSNDLDKANTPVSHGHKGNAPLPPTLEKSEDGCTLLVVGFTISKSLKI